MKQQESNLFDKGMSLDTNPIAMDNHTLSGALNATMITMNGNELVLQNDMGNARVETAYLPDGFVPVGMKEHGGIVYVASYNPISGQSLVGSFPSPERNLSNEDTGQPPLTFAELDAIVSRTGSTELVKITYGREAVVIPSEYESDRDIIRPGDLIAFYGLISTALKTYAELSAIIVDSDNNSIDITENIIGSTLPTTQPVNIPYYKGKISGKVYLIETLKLPNYLKVAVGATKNDSNNTLTLTLTPSVDEENFLSNYNYYINYVSPNGVRNGNIVSKGGVLTISGLPTSGIVTYEAWLNPTYGRIASIYRSGSIDLSKVGTGEVEFNYFFYYNDIKREQIQFDYDITAYLKDNQEIVDCYLSLQELDVSQKITGSNQVQIFNNPTHKIELSIDSMGGNFSSIIPFGSGADGSPATTLAMGKIYFGTLNITTAINGTLDPVKTAKTPLCIITSSVTNEYYMDHSTGNSTSGENFMSMLVPWSLSGGGDSNAIKIQLNAEIDWTESSKDSISKETDIPGLTNDAAIISENDEGYDTKKVIFYGKLLKTNTVVTVTPNVKILYPDESFPLDEEIIVTCSNNDNDNTYSRDIDWTASNNSIKSTLSNGIQGVIEPVQFEESIEDLRVVGSAIVQKLNQNTNDKKIVITFENTLSTKFYGELCTNPEYYEDNNGQALVPYMNFNDLYKVEQLTGTTIFENGNPESDIRPENWFSFETYESGKNNRNRKVAIMNTDMFYENTREAGGIPSQGETTETNSITLFHTTSTNANWNFYSKTIVDYYHNDLGLYPSILFLQGCNERGTSLRKSYPNYGWAINDISESVDWEENRGIYSTANYSIPIMFSTSGDLYMLNEVGWITKTYHPLSDIVKCLAKIYVLQSDLVIALQYKKTEEYIYMMPYTITVNVPVKANVKLKFENYPKYVQINNTMYVLPKFTLNPAGDDSITEEYIASYSASNPDIYSEIENYINVLLQLSGCAIVPKDDGTSKVITQAVWNNTKENIDSSHPYYWDGTNLIDCYVHEVPTSTSKLANYLNKEHQYLVIRKDVDTDYNTIYVNKATLNKIIVPDNKVTRTIGVGDGKETMLGDIATHHVINGVFGLSDTLYLAKPN